MGRLIVTREVSLFQGQVLYRAKTIGSVLIKEILGVLIEGFYHSDFRGHFTCKATPST